MLPLVWKAEEPGLLTRKRGGAIGWASVDRAVVELGSALLGLPRSSRAQTFNGGGKTSTGGIRGGCQGIALLPVMPLEVVLQ